MNIARIEVFRLAVPFSAGERAVAEVAGDDAFNAASPNIARMECLMVRVTTDTGLQGWGEAFGHGLNPVTFVALERLAAPFFLGTAVADRHETWQRASRAFHGFGRTGAVHYALSAIDIALWDLAAQAAGKPLYALLGGASPEVGLYASLVSYGNDPAEVARQVRRVYDLGFRRMKLHETAVEAMAAAREALPADAALMVDVNCPWTVEEAIAVAERAGSLGLDWLEEPVWPPDDAHGLARVRTTGVPVAAGENASGVEGVRQLLEAGAIDVFQPSVAKLGGVTGVLEAVALARQHGVAVVPHCFYYGPGLLAAGHLAAWLGPEVPLEVPFVQFERNLHPFLAFRPRMRLPERPGLGFEPDGTVLQDHLIAYVELDAMR